MAENKKTDKPTGNKMFCNPTPKAYELADAKKKIRGMQRQDPNNLYWLREHNRHTKAIENATPLIDTKPPLVRKSNYHKTAALNTALHRQTTIESANAVLVRQLASIYNGEIQTGLQTKSRVPLKLAKNRTQDRALRAVNIMAENFKKFQALKNVKPKYSTKELLQRYASQQAYTNRAPRFTPFQAIQPSSFPFRKIMENAIGNPKQYAYLLVEVEDKQAENLVFELCKKVEELHSVQVMTGRYKKVYWAIGSHVDSAIEYTQLMSKETSSIPHKEAGLVTRPKGRAGGVFFITVGPCPHLDHYCYVFGKIDDNGMDFLNRMEKKNTEENGQLIINMHITDCGVLAKPEDVPPPMLLRDFINQARLEILPFIKKKPNDDEDRKAQKSDFADHLKIRAKESKLKQVELSSELRNLVELAEMEAEADVN